MIIANRSLKLRQMQSEVDVPVFMRPKTMTPIGHANTKSAGLTGRGMGVPPESTRLKRFYLLFKRSGQKFTRVNITNQEV
jgi:hypothetical protein